MTKFITLFAFILLSHHAFAQGDLSATLKGQSQSAKLTVGGIQVPNSQATKTGSINALIETGNNNLLADPSYEGDIAVTPWTGPNTKSTSTPIAGLANASRNYSSAAVNIYQDSTTNAASFVDLGQQGLASIYVRTNSDANNVYVCQRQAGALIATSNGTSITNCVQVINDSKWRPYKLPVILGATSNGIAVVSLNATTAAAQNMSGFVDVDNAFLGLSDLRQDVINITPWQAYTPTITGLGTVTSNSFRWRQVGDSIEVEGTFVTGTPSATLGSFSLPNSYTLDTTKIPIANVSTAAGLAVGKFHSTGANLFGAIVTATGTSTSVVYLANVISNATNGLIPTDGSASMQASRSMSVSFRVPISTLNATSEVLASSSQDTDWASCGHTTSDFTGFGTVSSIETFCKRQGGDLLMRGKFVSGTSTAVEARINLKLNGVTLTSAPVASIPTIQDVGRGTRNFSSANTYAWVTLIEPSVTYFTIGVQANATNGLAKRTGSDVMGSGDVFSFHTRIPIAGWQTNLIFGSFNEVVTTRGLSKPVQYSFKVAQGTITTNCTASPCTIYNNAGSLATGVTRSSAGIYVATLDATKFSYLNCGAFLNNGTSGSDRNCAVDGYNGTGTSLTIACANNAAAADQHFVVNCHGSAP